MIAFRYRSVDGVYKPLMRLAITWTRIKYRDEKRWRLNLNEQVPVFQVHDRRDRSIIRGSEWIMAVGRRVLPNNPLLIEIAILSIMPCSFVFIPAGSEPGWLCVTQARVRATRAPDSVSKRVQRRRIEPRSNTKNEKISNKRRIWENESLEYIWIYNIEKWKKWKFAISVHFGDIFKNVNGRIFSNRHISKTCYT